MTQGTIHPRRNFLICKLNDSRVSSDFLPECTVIEEFFTQILQSFINTDDLLLLLEVLIFIIH
jgi:hypothetical protein